MKTLRAPRRQTGSMLLEALIGILIFSMGVLSIVGLQAVANKNASAAKYRTEASLYANQLLGEMWVSDRATMAANYSSNNGASPYTTWRDQVMASTGLPVPVASPPTVEFDTSAPPVVTITIFWQAPGETVTHNFKTVAQIE